MLRYDILIKWDEIRKGGAHNALDLYQLDIENIIWLWKMDLVRGVENRLHK